MFSVCFSTSSQCTNRDISTAVLRTFLPILAQDKQQGALRKQRQPKGQKQQQQQPQQQPGCQAQAGPEEQQPSGAQHQGKEAGGSSQQQDGEAGGSCQQQGSAATAQGHPSSSTPQQGQTEQQHKDQSKVGPLWPIRAAFSYVLCRPWFRGSPLRGGLDNVSAVLVVSLRRCRALASKKRCAASCSSLAIAACLSSFTWGSYGGTKLCGHALHMPGKSGNGSQ